MRKKKSIITAECPLFVCRICQTKTGYPHQKWCTTTSAQKAECPNCVYWREKSGKCGHPYKRKGEVK